MENFQKKTNRQTEYPKPVAILFLVVRGWTDRKFHYWNVLGISLLGVAGAWQGRGRGVAVGVVVGVAVGVAVD